MCKHGEAMTHNYYCVLSHACNDLGYTFFTCEDSNLEQCTPCKDYQAGITKPAYPVPTVVFDFDVNGDIWHLVTDNRWRLAN